MRFHRIKNFRKKLKDTFTKIKEKQQKKKEVKPLIEKPSKQIGVSFSLYYDPNSFDNQRELDI